jgi:hypothetical protein
LFDNKKLLKDFNKEFKLLMDLVDASKECLGSKFSVEGLRLIIGGNERGSFHSAVIADDNKKYYSFVFVLPLTGSMKLLCAENDKVKEYKIDKAVLYGCDRFIAWDKDVDSKSLFTSALTWIVTNNPTKNKYNRNNIYFPENNKNDVEDDNDADNINDADERNGETSNDDAVKTDDDDAVEYDDEDVVVYDDEDAVENDDDEDVAENDDYDAVDDDVGHEEGSNYSDVDGEDESSTDSNDNEGDVTDNNDE